MAIELFTAAVVLRMFVLHTERATDEELDGRELQASRLVGWGLCGLVASILATSVWSLASGSRPESSPVASCLPSLGWSGDGVHLAQSIHTND